MTTQFLYRDLAMSEAITHKLAETNTHGYVTPLSWWYSFRVISEDNVLWPEVTGKETTAGDLATDCPPDLWQKCILEYLHAPSLLPDSNTGARLINNIRGADNR